MYIAKVIDGVIGEIVHYTKVFRNIPTQELLDERGYKKINNFKPYNNLTERLDSVAPYVSGTYVFTVEVVDMSADEITESKNSAMSGIRNTRDQLLKDTDWTQLPDSTANASAYAVYRTALRDIPQNMGDADPRTWDDYPSLSLDGSSAGGV